MHTHAVHARRAPPPHQTDITATWPIQLTKCPILSTCVDYYDTPVNVSVTLSGESNRDVLLTWEEPPEYEGIIVLWYRVRLYSSSSSYSSSYVTTVNNAFLWEDLAPSTYYCASVRVESVHSQYTYYSNNVCFYTGGSQGECTAHSPQLIDCLRVAECYLIAHVHACYVDSCNVSCSRKLGIMDAE